MEIKLNNLFISETASVREALQVIDGNMCGIGIVVENGNYLIGTVTDGDIRRSLLKGFDLNESVLKVVKRGCVSLNVSTSKEEIQSRLSSKITYIPLVDDENKVVDFASHYRYKQIPVLEPFMEGNELEYVTECIRTNWVSSQGKFVTRFEQMLAELTGMPYCLAVCNGTVALHLALVAMGVSKGDEVIVPNLTFAATINAVLYTGAIPVIVDVDSKNWNIAINDLEKAISKNTKLILPVHLYGAPANMDELTSIAKENNCLVLEDAAEAIGSVYKGKACGSLGDAAIFSFFGNKTITTGEGGAILFNSTEVYQKARILRDHGMSTEKKYWHNEIGFNYRLTNLQAAVGVAQLEKFANIIEKKQQLMKWYKKHLMHYPGISDQILEAATKSSNWLYSVVLKNLGGEDQRNQIIKKLQEKGIDSRPIFYPLSDMPVYSKYAEYKYSVSESISYKGLSLPTNLSLNEDDVEYISKVLIEELKLLTNMENISKEKVNA